MKTKKVKRGDYSMRPCNKGKEVPQKILYFLSFGWLENQMTLIGTQNQGVFP
jgi:hypothetical protein